MSYTVCHFLIFASFFYLLECSGFGRALLPLCLIKRVYIVTTKGLHFQRHADDIIKRDSRLDGRFYELLPPNCPTYQAVFVRSWDRSHLLLLSSLLSSNRCRFRARISIYV